MIELDETYKQLARTWPQEELAARYRTAERRGARIGENPRTDFARALPKVATVFPPATSLSVAVYVLHLLRESARSELALRLTETAEQYAASALHRCHRALELDGGAHAYTAEDWLPTIYDVAATLLRSARLDEEPPTVVRGTQEAVSWLSRALIELEQDSAEIANTLSEALGRLLAIWVFADTARNLTRSR